MRLLFTIPLFILLAAPAAAQEMAHNWPRLGFGALYTLALWAAVWLLSKYQ